MIRYKYNLGLVCLDLFDSINQLMSLSVHPPYY